MKEDFIPDVKIPKEVEAGNAREGKEAHSSKSKAYQELYFSTQ
jgi:hypothetical protein